MILCRSISDTNDVNAWIRTGPKADKLYKGFEPAENSITGKFEVSVNRCLDYSDILLSTMAVRATRSTGMKQTPVIVAITMDDNILAEHGIDVSHTPDNGSTGFAEIDNLHYDLIADNENSFKKLAVALYTSHFRSGKVIHTLNNGCLLRGCKSLIELSDTDRHNEGVRRLINAADWLEQQSDVLNNVDICPRPQLWDSSDPRAMESPSLSKHPIARLMNWFNCMRVKR